VKKSTKKVSDTLVVVGIFLMIGLYTASMLLSYVSEPVEVLSKNSTSYPFFWGPLMSNLMLFVSSGVFLWIAYRVGSCIFTKIISWLFLTLVVNSLIYIIFAVDYAILFWIAYFSIIGFIALFSSLMLIGICLLKSGQ
jgi:hypothetical protein